MTKTWIPRPEWTKRDHIPGTFSFVNEYGEVWCASLRRDGTLLVTGKDVGWEVKRLQLPLKPGSGSLSHQLQWYLTETEAAWLARTVSVAETMLDLNPESLHQ